MDDPQGTQDQRCKTYCPVPPQMSRRSLLTQMSTLGVMTLVSCGRQQRSEPFTSDMKMEVKAGVEADTTAETTFDVCELTPPQIEGPYYLNLSDERSEMIRDRMGIPLLMNLRVTHRDCAPVAGALVEVWHADAHGVYSGFADQVEDTTGLEFLRGEAKCNQNGEVQFVSIYPGWYPGRAVHIHFKVSLHNTTLLTSQFYLPDEVSTQVYRQAIYEKRGEQDTLVSNDRFFLRAGDYKDLLMARVEPRHSGYMATIQVTV